MSVSVSVYGCRIKSQQPQSTIHTPPPTITMQTKSNRSNEARHELLMQMDGSKAHNNTKRERERERERKKKM